MKCRTASNRTGGRPGEVQGAGRLFQEGGGVAQVRVDVAAPAGRAAGEQGPGVDQDQGVVVGIDNRAIGRGLLGQLVGAGRRGQPGADVEELPDAASGGQITHRPGKERAVGPGADDHLGPAPDHCLGGAAVGMEVVLAAKPVVVDPGRMGGIRVETGRHSPVRARTAALSGVLDHAAKHSQLQSTIYDA
jgi:hypothetical protein